MDIEKIEEELQGTCKTISDVSGYNKEQEEIMRLIGERGNIECCEVCSWWCEMGEMVEKDGGFMCEDCAQ